MENNYFDALAAAEYLGVSLNTFRRWAKKANLRTFYQFGHGKRLYYVKMDLDVLKKAVIQKGV